MKKPVIFLLLLLCVAVGLVAILLRPVPGPKYKGRPLASWLADLGDPKSQATARQTIIEGGTNIVPALLEIRLARDHGLDRYVKLIGTRINPRFQPRREALRYKAAEAFRLLGTNAAFAIIPYFATNNLLLDSSNIVSGNPIIINQQPVHEIAEVMLFDFQTNSVPAFVAGLRGSNLLVRFNLCYALALNLTVEVHQNTNLSRLLIDAVAPTLAIGSARAASTAPIEGPLLSMSLHALRQLGIQRDYPAIVPDVITLLDHPDSGVRYNAAYFLQKLAPKTDQVRSALKEALEREKVNPGNDAMGVMMIGPRSKEVLLGGLNDALQANQ